MTTSERIHRMSGEALELAQLLEISLANTILMISIIEAGGQKDLGPEELAQLESDPEMSKSIKSKPIDRKFRQDWSLRIVQIQLLVKNGTMGELTKALTSRLGVSPGGPSVFLPVLQEALDARNFLCHEFFRAYATEAPDRASARLEEIHLCLRKAISLSDSIAGSLSRSFPRTFGTELLNVH